MGTLNENVAELRRLLGIGLINGRYTAQHPIRKCVERVLEFHNKRDYASRDYENARLALLAKNLREIEGYDNVNVLLNVFRKALIRSNDDTYFGIRFEVSTAASLIRSGTPFAKSESPDFVLTDRLVGAFIECGSAHLSKPKPGIADLKYKIGSVVRDKSRHDYCHEGTALFIDFTNINYHNKNNESMPSVHEWRDYLQQLLQSANFGSIVLWTYIINMDKNKYQWKYTRADAKDPNKALVEFLNAAYPFGHDVTHTYAFLRQG